MSASDVEALSPLKRALLEIRQLKARVAQADRRSSEPIAVVGIGLRFPGGAVDAESFWEVLSTGVDAIVEVPPERWSIADLYDEDPDVPGRMATRFGGFLAGIDRFDAPFFGISPREAQSMDPQQRLLLEVTWEALENAGIAVDSVFGSNTGVFLGISNNDYLRMLLADPDDIDTYTITGNALSVAAGRLSYVLGAQGPALAIDTACSSSLVAVHLAMQALRGGETDLALAGGVSLILGPEMTINFSRARMLAADGHCKTFDAAADGYVRSEGCAMIALKRLGDAEADGDRILGVIRGSAVTQDGRSGGLTAPNGPSQEKVLTAALVGAGVDPLAVSYVEAHGTGTPLGDPIEVGALGAVLCRGRAADQPLLLGSVKTNLGHMEAAAGVGGLIKVLLMLEHATIAPHLHLTELHPYIAAEQLPIAVPTEATPWATSGPRIAGVSSFGLSGTNAHLVVEQAPARAAGSAPAADGAVHVLALSAKTPAALDAVAERYVAHLAAHPEQSLADVAATAATGRSHFDHRLAVVARDTSTALTRLRGHLAGAAAHAVVATAGRASSSEVVFLFSGHGAHDAGAGHVLYAEQPVFRAAIDRCGELLAGELDEPLTAVLFDADHDLLDSMRYAQPALFSLQYALAELWQSWGVRASVVAGHSAGEYVAAVVAGVLDLADGLRIISARGRLMHSLPAGGEMVAIFATEADVAAAVERCGGPVGIAAVNGPTTTVISGRSDAVAAVLADLALDDDDFRRLPISVAAHSPLVDPILDEFEAVVASVRLGRPQIGLVSSMTGELVDEEITRPDYWRRHLRQPVRFADVFATLRAAGCSTFVEIGPRSTLLSLGQRCWPDDSATWAASLRPDGDEAEQIATSLASVHVAGAPVDWRAFDQSSARRRRLALPSYPWQRESYWSPAAQSHGRQRATPVWPAVVTAAERQAQHGPLDLQLDRYEARWSILDRLAVAYIGAAVRDLGLFRAAGERIVVRELIAAGRVPPTYVHLVERWLGHLVDDGALQRDGDGFVSIRALPPPDIAALVGEAHIAFVGAEPLLDYVSRCGERLAAVISGEENALATLFPDGSYETVDYLYNQWPVPRYFNAILGAAATAAADARPGRPVRVLEIGAGTGGTSASVLPALPADRTAYVFTDVSDFFLARAAERFAAFPFVRYARFDIERPPADQGFAPETYDLIVAANVLHATSNLDVSLAHARSLLAPGGVLLVYESTRNPRWLDITTGLIEGWQRFDDGWRDDHPLITAARWSEALLASGFADVLALPAAGAATAVFGQAVLIARAPGEPEANVASGAAWHEPGQPGRDGGEPSGVAVPSAGVLTAALAGALPVERGELLIGFVRQAIAHVLRITDADRLQRDQPLLDIGFDSLMAVELRNVLRTGLALQRKLPATLVFDHPNIAAIAAYLDRLLADDDGQDVDVRPSAAPVVGATAVAEMSDDDVEALLLQKLAEISDA